MNQEINNQYKIKFRNQISKFDGFPSEIDKQVDTINVTLSIFLYEWSSVDGINEDLLPSLDNLDLNDNIQSETVGVYVADGIAKMYRLFNTSSSPVHPDLTLSLSDLKEIVKNWKEFLLQNPLNGTVI